MDKEEYNNNIYKTIKIISLLKKESEMFEKIGKILPAFLHVKKKFLTNAKISVNDFFSAVEELSKRRYLLHISFFDEDKQQEVKNVYINNMKKIKTIKDADVFAKPEFPDLSKYKKRVTVKAIVKNKDGKYAFVTNSVHNFILLAGGGAESENLIKEINRECEEEIFYSIKNIKELFRIKEFRNRSAKEYETVCFYGEIDKNSEQDTRTDDEKNNNLTVIWLDKKEALDVFEKQVKQLKKGEVKFYNTAFNILRDYKFFKEYMENEK